MTQIPRRSEAKLCGLYEGTYSILKIMFYKTFSKYRFHINYYVNNLYNIMGYIITFKNDIKITSILRISDIMNYTQEY